MLSFDDKLLADFADSFLGYGRLEASTWLIGMEEGGGGSFEEIDQHLNVWAGREKRPLEDLFEYHKAINVDNWFTGPRPRLQPTWAGLIRILFGLRGEAASNESIRNHQKHIFGRATGDERLMELFPLPSPSTQHWLYAEHSNLLWLANRATYKSYQATRRDAESGRNWISIILKRLCSTAFSIKTTGGESRKRSLVRAT